MKKVAINRFLSLSRAARLVGVKRGTLQKRIQDGDIHTFEGEISIEELLKAYPQAELEDNSMIEHTNEIKELAINKVVDDGTILPSLEILTTRVKQLSSKLAHANALLSRYTRLEHELRVRLEELKPDKNDIDDLKSWLNSSLDMPVTPELDAERLIAEDTLLSLMASHIRILPSGHDFFSEGESSILEAGLRAGMSLDYGCSNGNCGACMAKLLSGEIKQIAHHDYIISPELKQQGYLLMCCNTALTDIVIEAGEAHDASDIPEQTLTAKVKKISFANDDVALVHLKTPRTNRLRFLAGQYVSLQSGNTDKFNHSIASCPCDDMNLHFQVPLIKDNIFSNYVFNSLKAGDSININGPYGDFTLDEESPRSLVFIAWHTGFAPIRSLIEHAMALDVAESIHLIWITPETTDRYMNNLCRSWVDALDNFYYTPINAELDDDIEENESLISNTLTDLDDLRDYDFYVSGNTALLDAAKNVLINNGLPENQFNADLIQHD